MTYGPELRWQNAGERGSIEWRGIKGRKNGTTVVAQSKKYILKTKQKKRIKKIIELLG